MVSKNCVKLVSNKSNFYTYLENDKVVNKAGHKDGKRMEEGEEGGWSFETENREIKKPVTTESANLSQSSQTCSVWN